MTVCAGVDGCRGGWIAVWRHPGAEPTVAVFETFGDLLKELPDDAIIAVDMPIGLPERIQGKGRVAEQEARRRLYKRKSSIFSIPSRSAVYLEVGPFAKGTYIRAHARASQRARETSDTGAGISIQAFGIFPKIREIDAFLLENPALQKRVFESHPEIAFCTLNSSMEMVHKKSTGAGEDERRQVLVRFGFPVEFLQRRVFDKAKVDDFLDACAMLLVAERLQTGVAVSHPAPLDGDGRGLPIAIWA